MSDDGIYLNQAAIDGIDRELQRLREQRRPEPIPTEMMSPRAFSKFHPQAYAHGLAYLANIYIGCGLQFSIIWVSVGPSTALLYVEPDRDVEGFGSMGCIEVPLGTMQ